jgi:hypothetical protein
MSHLLVAALVAWRVLASTPDGRRYAEVMRSEVTATGGEVERAHLRIWMAPVRSLDTRGCPDGDSAEHFRCWCERVCGLRFEDRPEEITISWPIAEAGGPGFEVEPGGRVRACFYSDGSRVPYFRITCPAPAAVPPAAVAPAARPGTPSRRPAARGRRGS